MRKIRVWAEKTFRGKRYPEPVIIEPASYKTDYRLLPKDEEAEYCRLDQPIEILSQSRILPKTTDFPPLLKKLIIQESIARGVPNPDPKLEIVYAKNTLNLNYRIAKEGEIPTVDFQSGLGTPASPSLYENINL